ncbi:DedA family protein [Candidatus Woesearchaeota archaeon]|nr:DedA family protein [Candidatus Woesearchaeota archaeon]
MNIITLFFDIILHLDEHLSTMIQMFGGWSYAILFTILFLETGVVIAPYLPGDSLLFAVGTFSAIGTFNLWLIFTLLALAAILGDSLNYAVGHYIGPKVFRTNYKWLDRRALDRTKEFFDKYGGKTIIIARFVPIIRTFAPFLAGVGAMKYPRFLAYNIIGGLAWVGLFLFGGYFFGNIPIIKNNFSIFILIIISISLLPVAIEAYKYYKDLQEQKKAAKATTKAINNSSSSKKQKAKKRL